MIKLIDDDTYTTVCDWWRIHGFQVQPREVLAPLGFVAFVHEKPVFAIWLYKAVGCALGVMTFPVFNPSATSEERGKSFDEMMFHVEEEARKHGIKALVTATNNERFCQRLIKSRFVVTDQSVTHLCRGL